MENEPKSAIPGMSTVKPHFKLKRILIPIGMLCFFIFFGMDIYSALSRRNPSPSEIHQALLNRSEKQNKLCPISIDDETELTSTSVSSDNTFTQYSRLKKYKSSEINKDTFTKSMRASIIQTLKKKSIFHNTVKSKCYFSFSYSGSDNTEFTYITITKKDIQ